MRKLPFLSKSVAPVAEQPSKKKLTISFDQPVVEINGIDFKLLKSDADIFEDALRIADKYASLDINSREAVIEAIREMVGYVDTILGDGAMKQISGGLPVSIAKAQECMIKIARLAADSYEAVISEKYDD